MIFSLWKKKRKTKKEPTITRKSLTNSSKFHSSNMILIHYQALVIVLEVQTVEGKTYF